MSLKPALFLDRDGTLIVDTDFVRSPEEVVLTSGGGGSGGTGQCGGMVTRW